MKIETSNMLRELTKGAWSLKALGCFLSVTYFYFDSNQVIVIFSIDISFLIHFNQF